YSDDQPILWFSPDPRFVLDPERLHLSRSLRKAIRQEIYEIRLDTAFTQVVQACRSRSRPDQAGTWITREMVTAYTELHELGYAHSAEAWRNGQLVGGLYGVCIGGLFSGESMFALEPDASKVAFSWLVGQLVQWGVQLVDCQVHTEHLQRFGAHELPRSAYLETLADLVRLPTRTEAWNLDVDYHPLSKG
ncbi:MAG: leucyl/phenylalanyl-tRNA--protein transferase, partial [Myxococcota bacterium]|nr:leucyl/phenylalanyl-tRNA--protein transferase [Myxococcota bacterium]